MTLNLTAALLEARMNPVLLAFGKAVTTSSTFLDGAGGIGRDGTPVPLPGHVTGIRVWDGTALHSTDYDHALSAGDRVAVFASYNGSTFDVYVIVNGNFTNAMVSGVPANSTLQVSVPLLLGRA